MKLIDAAILVPPGKEQPRATENCAPPETRVGDERATPVPVTRAVLGTEWELKVVIED